MSLLDRLRGGLSRTREVLTTPIEDVVRGRRPLDESALETIEEALLAADLGVPAVQEATAALREHSGQVAAGGLEAMRQLLRGEIRRALDRPSPVQPFSTKPWVVFLVGVNGAGKTTTIGKLAASWTAEGRSVLVCAADTFRAAAAEQLEVWAGRAGASFHRGPEGADPSAVLTDALRSARAHGTDAVLVDTAGRLHTKSNLMAELEKMRRTAAKVVPGAPHEVLLVLDATTGQNGLEQARRFTESSGVTGIVLTKLDGTAKGGIVVAIARELNLPIRYVGIGEQAGDLLAFEPDKFVASLFAA